MGLNITIKRDKWHSVEETLVKNRSEKCGYTYADKFRGPGERRSQIITRNSLDETPASIRPPTHTGRKYAHGEGRDTDESGDSAAAHFPVVY